MRAKYVFQCVLLIGFCMASCTFKEEVTSAPTLATKSFVDNKYALSEQEIVLKAEQFFLGIESSKQSNGEARSISDMNLSEKMPQVKTVVRTIEYAEDDTEQIPVYIINYTDKRSKATGGFVVMTGDKRLNQILVYSDTGSWGDEDPLIQNFSDMFWRNVDEFIKNELAASDLSIITKSGSIDPCEYYSVFEYHDNAYRLLQPALWSQLDPYNAKLAPVCTPPPTGYSLYPPVGCVATAMGEIMAYHKKPTSGSYVNYLGTTVSTTYNWTTMLDSQYIGGLSSTGQEMVQNLLAEIGQLMVLNQHGYYYPLMTYGCLTKNPITGELEGGSKSDMASARQGFALMGYTTAPIGIDYDFNAVVTEINANRPVFACGNKNLSSPLKSHAWVMDGVNQQMVIEYIYRYCPSLEDDDDNPHLMNTLFSYPNYVYCNIGAEIPANHNGYYRSELFLKYTVEDTVILTNIK